MVEQLSRREVAYTLGGVLIGLFLAALDQTVVGTALPVIVSELGGKAWYAWVAVVYLLASTIAAPIFGRLTEIYPRKRILLWAMLLFLGGSALCGLTPGRRWGFPWLLVGRGVQGAGGGALFALAFTTLAWLFPPRERSRWAGLIGALFGIAGALGPALGGFLAQHWGWRWAFWLNIPLLLVAMFLVGRYLPNLPVLSRAPFDTWGAILLGGWAGALFLGFSGLGPQRLFSAWATGGFLLAGLVLFVFWVRLQRSTPSPLFALEYLQTPTFRYAALSVFFFGPVFIGGVTFLPLYLQEVLGYSPLESGLYLLFLTVSAVFSTAASGVWVARHGRYKGLLLISAFLLFGVMAWAALALPATISPAGLLGVLGLIALVFGPLQALLSVVAQNDIPQSRIGTITSSVQFARQMGSTIGLALLNLLYALPATSLAASTSLLMGLRWAFGGMASLSALLVFSLWALPDRPLRTRRIEEEISP